MAEVKQVIVMRNDLKMGVGKLAAQAAHASLMSYFEAVKIDKKIAETWLKEGEKKIVLKADNVEIIEKLYGAFNYKGIPCALVSDAGLTQLPPGTKTALGIGPWTSEEIDAYTSFLKLL